MSSSSAPPNTLDPTLHTLSASLSALQTLLSAPLPTTTPSSLPPEDTSTPAPALPLLKASATLLKAQTTKLSLLLLHPPLAHPAAQQVLHACDHQCVPALAAACDAVAARPDRWPCAVRADVRSGVRGIVAAFADVVGLVRRAADAGAADAGAGGGKKEGEGFREAVLGATGVLWKGCDGLVAVVDGGVGSVLARKVEQCAEVLEDARVELKDWAAESGENEDEPLGSNGEDEDGVDVMFGPANGLPKDRKDIQERLDEALRRLRLMRTGYQAMVKRRIKAFPEDGTASQQKERVTKVDRLMEYLEKIPDTIDDLASAFYELDVDEVDAMLEQACSDARSAASMIELSWDDKEDEFTTWIRKWEDALKPKQSIEKPD